MTLPPPNTSTASSVQAIGVLLAAPKENLAARTVAAQGAGVVVEPEDREGWVLAAEKLLGDPEKRTALGRAGRAYAEQNFVIDKVADRFEAVLSAARRLRENGAARPV